MGYCFERGHGAEQRAVSHHVYGATWAGTSSTALTRTDDAAGFADPVPYVSGATTYGSPFDDLMPWKGMVRVTDPTVGELVEIPKFWYKLTKDGAALSIQIADYEADGFHVSPAHMDRGDGAGERDAVYIGRYHCCTSNTTSEVYKSITGLKPGVNVTRSVARRRIHQLGAEIWQMDFAMRFTIWLLYIVEFADWDSQSKVGFGTGNGSGVQTMGASDAMPYHTGTMQSSRNTEGVGVQYRWIEGLWDNCNDWMDGCYYSAGKLCLILNPSSFSDNENGTLIGTPSSGYISALTLSTEVFPLFYPSESNGSEMRYIPDQWSNLVVTTVIFSGGNYGSVYDAGLFASGTSGSNATNNGRGTRLMKLP